VERTLPRKIEKEHFGTIMAIVAARTYDNSKVAALRENLGYVSGVLAKALQGLL
jgi:hypothetical protein